MQLHPLGVAAESDQPEASPESRDGDCVVEMKHFLSAIAKIKPSVSEKVSFNIKN